jgi:hypothetical protein
VTLTNMLGFTKCPISGPQILRDVDTAESRQLSTMKRVLGISLSTLLLSTCYAFEDTSPFILAVSHKYPRIPVSERLTVRTHHSNAFDSTTQIPITISADHFHTIARQTVSHCSSDLYILVSQPGLHVTDLTASTVPYLRKIVKNAESKITADYGHGIVDLEDISLLAQEKCHAEATFVDARRIIFRRGQV